MTAKSLAFLISALLVLGVIAYIAIGLIVVRQAHTAHAVSDEQLLTVQDLFAKNDIDESNLVIKKVSTDNRGAAHVLATQLYRGLPWLNGELIYHFNSDGKLIPPLEGGAPHTGEKIGEVNISLEPKISAYAAARKVSTKMLPRRSFTAELGLYDLNAGTSYAEQNLILAWFVKPIDTTYPDAYVDAMDEKILSYDDGIRY